MSFVALLSAFGLALALHTSSAPTLSAMLPDPGPFSELSGMLRSVVGARSFSTRALFATPPRPVLSVSGDGDATRDTHSKRS